MRLDRRYILTRLLQSALRCLWLQCRCRFFILCFATCSVIHSIQTDLKSIQVSPSEKKSKEVEKRDIRSSVICMEEKEELMAADCGHTCCSVCSERLPTCHVCRKPTKWKHIFL
ncbi:hypothetical protein BKA69DRAFT_71824 [Paraphysoderma sedebokerense]|nr:hypothetical protein BKA69DRAFT_71824 [Paraphysoderma sedebokerense]